MIEYEVIQAFKNICTRYEIENPAVVDDLIHELQSLGILSATPQRKVCLNIGEEFPALSTKMKLVRSDRRCCTGYSFMIVTSK